MGSGAEAAVDGDSLAQGCHGNHAHSEARPPARDLIRECLAKGFGTRLAWPREAEPRHGRAFSAPLGNARKRRAGGGARGNRVTRDLKAAGVSALRATPERT
eukprot:8827741-Pyramimonas_sp.AAC.1